MSEQVTAIFNAMPTDARMNRGMRQAITTVFDVASRSLGEVVAFTEQPAAGVAGQLWPYVDEAFAIGLADAALTPEQREAWQEAIKAARGGLCREDKN